MTILTQDNRRQVFRLGLKILPWAGSGVILVAAIAALGIIFFGLSDDVQRSDVAVILGSKIELNGRPSARLAARLDSGLALYQTGITKTLIVSGGTGVEGFNEATVMRDYLVQRGVPISAVIVDGMGNNTDQTARNCAALMRERGFSSVIIVTQYFHVLRTWMALRHHNIQPIHTVHARYVELRDLYSIAREVIAIPTYWIGGR